MTSSSIRLIAVVSLASIVALSQLEPVYSRASDTVGRRRKEAASSVREEVDEEEKMEKIGEDIALLKLDDKVYWNRFLQSSGSMADSPSAAPSMEDGDDDDDDDDGEYIDLDWIVVLVPQICCDVFFLAHNQLFLPVILYNKTMTMMMMMMANARKEVAVRAISNQRTASIAETICSAPIEPSVI